jgi:hypothetical protein
MDSMPRQRFRHTLYAYEARVNLPTLTMAPVRYRLPHREVLHEATPAFPRVPHCSPGMSRLKAAATNARLRLGTKLETRDMNFRLLGHGSYA